jgi:hypothetical protein
MTTNNMWVIRKLRRNKKKKKRFRAQSKRQISWIWKVPKAGEACDDVAVIVDGAEEASDALKVEWAKTQARAERFAKEVELVLEEMKRVLRYFSWKASWWRDIMGNRSNEHIRAGCAAYSQKQAFINEAMRQKCSTLWGTGLKALLLDDRILYED